MADVIRASILGPMPHMNTPTRPFLAAAFLLAGCTAQPTVDVEAERAALREAATAYHTAVGAKDGEAVVGMYDQSALMVPPNADLVEGLAGVQNYRFGFIENAAVEIDFEIQRVEVSAAGDIGWTLAIGEITINQAEGPPGRDLVRDFHTWKKQPDGSWKVVVDVWNSGMPAA
jgi:ketosteroid isomerase-like protein